MLYYIDVSSKPIIEEFIPRIPENRMDDEDAETERICLAKTLEGCFSASSELEELYSRHKSCPNEIFRVYVFDENDILKEENFTDSYVLWHDGLVPDANITGEVWIENQILIPKEIRYISVKNLEQKRVIQLSYEEFKEYDEEQHISEIFTDITNVTLDDFHKATKKCYILEHFQTKSVFYNMELQFYEKEELIFSQIIQEDYETYEFINLSKYIPSISDFCEFADSTAKRDMKNFIYDPFSIFVEKGIKFPYRYSVVPKKEFLALFKE